LLTALSISNYALIQSLQVDFTDGLSIITGETGAGKSILLGALGLVMGNRADLSNLKTTDKKCVIEAAFSIQNYTLQDFFEKHDLDYEEETILRREILPSGKSRAFVNDTPVTLQVLSALKAQLMDVHSQNTTAQLSEANYQFKIIDALASNHTLLEDYSVLLQNYKEKQKELEDLQKNQERAQQEYAYNRHLYNELSEASFRDGEQEELETTLEKLNNIEVIKVALAESISLANEDQVGIQSALVSLCAVLQKIASYSSEYEVFFQRIQSLKIELEDVVYELEKANEDVDFNPSEIEGFNDRLQCLYDLQKKHGVASIPELSKIQTVLEEKINQVDNASETLGIKEQEIQHLRAKLEKVASKIHQNRKQAIPKLTEQLQSVLTELGMENAQFKIGLEKIKSFSHNGSDQLSFLFSANKGVGFEVLKKVASGGEMSRIMLGVKLILSKYLKLPTIIFDEIDTGVSGEISNKIATVMNEMANYMQVVTITHLPQIAAKGRHHYKVYKKDVAGATNTYLKKLSTEERIAEVAEILGGKQISTSAMEHAKELLRL
jgi:DNA repair protein RecN (Recombination protein N)